MHGGGSDRGDRDVTNSKYWKRINEDVTKRVKAADSTVEFYQDVLQNSSSLLTTQAAEIKRLKKLLEERIPKSEEKAKDPLQNGNSDCSRVTTTTGKDAIAVLPEEVWNMILDEVEVAEDMESSFMTCQLFAKILNPRRHLWLFRKIFPFIYHHLDSPDILNCRLTCKNWMAAVDHRLDHNVESNSASVYTSIQEFYNTSYRGHPPPFALYNFSVPLSSGTRSHSLFNQVAFPIIDVNPEMIIPRRRNPFLGRSVSILNFLTTPPFIKDAFRFLDNCGQHIRYLMVRANRSQITCAEKFLRVLNGALAKTPNLKTLNLDLHEIRRTGAARPLCCPSLETLIIQHVPGYVLENEDKEGYAHALHSGLSQQLVRMEVNFWSSRFITSQWPNLKELKMSWVTCKEPLLGLLQVSMPALESLQLTFSSTTKVRIPRIFEHLLRIANHFPKLSSLELGHLIHVIDRGRHLAPLPPNLFASSGLTTLKVFDHIFQGPVWFSFIVRFPFLKNLYVFNDDGHRWRLPDKYWTWYPSGVSTRTKQFDYAKEVSKAPIWKILPNLQVLVFKFVSFENDDDAHNDNSAYTRQGNQMRALPRKTPLPNLLDHYGDQQVFEASD